MVEGLTYIEGPLVYESPCSFFALQLSQARDRRRPPRGGAVAARRAHNPKVRGSNPFPATKQTGSETDIKKALSGGPSLCLPTNRRQD